MYLSIGKASLILGVSISTLRAWERDGKIAPSFQTKGGHRRYSIVNLKEQFGLNNKNCGAFVEIGENRLG
jgi:DNA-binding transcriptional MerR regulator